MAATANAKRREREFPRYKVPLSALIDGKRAEVCDWSVAGLGLAAVDLKLLPDELVSVTVLIETEGSRLELTLNTKVVWAKPEEHRAGLQILDSEDKTAPLADFADLYLAGRILQNDSKILVWEKQMSEIQDAKTAVVGATLPAAGSNGLAGRVFGLSIFAIIGLAAFFFLFDIVYKRLFTFEAISASIAAETVSVFQPRDGLVEFENIPQKVRRGDKLATIVLDAADQNGNKTVDVISPCNCYVLSIDHPASTYGRAGSRILSLADEDATSYVSLRLPFRRLSSISGSPQISLTYLDGTTVTGVEILSVPKVTEYTATQLEILVKPGRDINPSMIGQPVLATFDVAPWH
ncbi:PilZ domain-containing protein [Sinorhizobium sp. BJ1]|uniref:PilZ domain-containing protein n=1 Tax=Sinorhizobium sp. BJ1 TaxID=2035455 RepID=UPI000BE8E32C|nr:PilZ domain-containing protein [Sinorhizobium sp. BJ1]PDT80345.1 hypothetical protein CO676_28095 [Sinorhizobium sp. BJ1]